MISIINKKQKTIDSAAADKLNKLINYALVCIQIAYPYVYNQLAEEPDFKNWNDKIASKLKLRPLSDDEVELLNSTEEFDEDWEKIVFRMCQKETYLSNRAFYVSALLGKIAEIINNDDELGDIIEATLEMSAVTNLKAFDTPRKLKEVDVPWAEVIWTPLKEKLSKMSDIKGSKPADRSYTIYKIKSINAQIVPWYRVKTNEAGVALETYGGEEVKTIIDDLLSKVPADSAVRQAELSQGKKNKDKWNWTLINKIDKYDSNIIQWYADAILAFYKVVEG